MRKLTAGIFTLLLGLVSVGTANAAVVSTEYLNQKLGVIKLDQVGGENKYIKSVAQTNGAVTAETGSIDSEVTANSTNLITSGAVSTAIAAANTAVTNLQKTVAANTAAVGSLMGDGDGSLIKAVSDAKTYTDTEVKKLADGAVASNTAALSILNGADTVDGSLAKVKKDLQANIELKADQTALDATNVKVAANEAAIAAEKTARESADNALQANIDLKANIADVYSKDAADKLFEAQTAATQKLADAKAYTDNQIKKLTEDLGSVGPGEDGTGGTGLQGTVAGHGVRIGALEDKVGDTSVVDRIAALKNVDEPVTKEFVKSVSQENGVITVTRAALVASDIPVIAISQVDGLQAALDAKQVKLTSTDGVIVIDASGNVSIASKSIGTGMIADSAITTEKINNGAVTSEKLGANAVTAGKIAADAVTEGTIADGAVVAGNLAQNAVTAGTIAAGAVTNATINDGELSVAKIKDLSTTLEKKFEVPAYETRTEDGMYVLTATQRGDQVTYAWENIAGR